MKKGIFLLAVICISSFFCSYAQKNWQYVNKENVSFKIPDGWKIENSTKKKGPMTVKAYDPNSTMFVEIRMERNKQNLKVRANDIATLRSQQQNFEYMQIDKVNKTQFKDKDAQLLTYTNTYLNDVSKGEIYTFVNEGYTYSVEYYGEDKPEVRQILTNIVNTVNVNSADKKENINDMDKRFVNEDWSNQEMDHSAEIAAQKAKEEAEKAEKDRLKARDKDLKAQKKAEKEAASQQKKIEKQQEKLAKQQAKIEKQQAELAKSQAKAEKERQKAERKQREREMNYDKLVSRQKSIEKELTSLAEKQLKLSEQYGQAQQKQDEKKMEKIQKEQAKLTDKVSKLNQERNQVIKKISKI